MVSRYFFASGVSIPPPSCRCIWTNKASLFTQAAIIVSRKSPQFAHKLRDVVADGGSAHDCAYMRLVITWHLYHHRWLQYQQAKAFDGFVVLCFVLFCFAHRVKVKGGHNVVVGSQAFETGRSLVLAACLVVPESFNVLSVWPAASQLATDCLTRCGSPSQPAGATRAKP